MDVPLFIFKKTKIKYQVKIKIFYDFVINDLKNEIEALTFSLFLREHPHTTSDFLGGGGVKPNPIFYM